MHFVFSYDLQAEGQKRTDLEQRILNILTPYRHVRSLNNFYIIHVQNHAEWEAIRSLLTAIAKEVDGTNTFYFVMSPPQTEGRYNGYLPAGEWQGINQLTDMQ